MALTLLAIGAVAASAALVASLLRLPSLVSYLLAWYLLAWAEIVVVVFSLSAGSWVRPVPLVVSFVAIAAASVIAWAAVGRPLPPSGAGLARRFGQAWRDPLVALPLGASSVALLYTLVVTLTTVPNDGDPLAYELTRAAFWRQEHGIVDLGAAYVPLDFWPPVAETAALVVMATSGSDQLTGLAQWFAVPMLMLGTYGVGRRVTLARRPALWAAALVPTFPVVIVQSWSAFTDLVFASFAVAAVYFGLGTTRRELAPLAIATGLAMGTKFLGAILAPLCLVILALAQPARRWPAVLGAAAAGAAVASLWYLRTLFETGHPVGNEGAGIQSRELAPVVTTFQQLTAEVFDLSGAAGRDVWTYALTGGAVAVAALLGRAVRGRGDVRSALVAAALVAAAPHAVSLAGRAWARTGLEVGQALGRPDLVDQLRGWRPSEVSDGAYSWFGPVGAAVAVGAVAAAISEVRRRRLPRVALAFGAAPLLALLLVSLAVSYQNHQGRYFVAVFALATVPVARIAVEHRWAGGAIGIVAAVTVALALVNALGKPSGIGLLRGDLGRSVWSMPRWEQQGILRSTPPERDEVLTFRFVEERVPEDASIGVALAYNSFLFPYFGERLTRRLTIVDEEDVVPPDVDWIVASPGRSVLACPGSWARARLGPYRWSVWRRTSTVRCEVSVRLPQR